MVTNHDHVVGVWKGEWKGEWSHQFDFQWHRYNLSMESVNISPAMQDNAKTSAMQAAAVVQEGGQPQADLMSDDVIGGWESQAMHDDKSLSCDDDDDDHNGWFNIKFIFYQN